MLRFSLQSGAYAHESCACSRDPGEKCGLSAFTLWKHENVHVTKGQDKIASYSDNPGSDHEGVVAIRQWCKNCGGHLFTDHPTIGLLDVPAPVISDFSFKPGFHVHYQESVQPITDDLPKFKDLPAEAGGSGEQLGY
ncbi:MAG: GFA family protein [Gammaproteobacteria bacterium]